jgi:hypothetical protein
MRAQRLAAGGQIRSGRVVEIAERCGEAVAAVLGRRAADAPQGVLQAAGQRHETLTAEHHLDMRPAGEGEAEMIEPVRQRLAGDADAKIGSVGEVGQPLRARRMVLAKNHVLVGPMQRLPSADAALQGAADTLGQLGMAAAHLLEEGNRPQSRHRDQHRLDLGLPDRRQRIGPPATTRHDLLRRRSGITIQPAAGAGAEPGPGGGGLLGERVTQ